MQISLTQKLNSLKIVAIHSLFVVGFYAAKTKDIDNQLLTNN